jgi:hypothetical protein
MEWKLTQKEIDKLWVKYEKENPDQGGLDTWDKRLILAEAKKLVEYIDNNFYIGGEDLPGDDKRWKDLKKEVGLE